MSKLLMAKYKCLGVEVYAYPMAFKEYRTLRDLPKVERDGDSDLQGYLVLRINVPADLSRYWVDQVTFKEQYSRVEDVNPCQSLKTLNNSTISQAKANISDLTVFGNGDTFKLICKASSKSQGWMKSTKAMEIAGVGCVIQVSTQQGDYVAEALSFVPDVKIVDIDGDPKNGRQLIKN